MPTPTDALVDTADNADNPAGADDSADAALTAGASNTHAAAETTAAVPDAPAARPPEAEIDLDELLDTVESQTHPIAPPPVHPAPAAGPDPAEAGPRPAADAADPLFADEPRSLQDYRRGALRETMVTTIVALLVLVLVYSLLGGHGSLLLTSIAIAGLTTVAFATIRYTLSPDRLRAAQTKRILSLAGKTLQYMRGGLSIENCQEVCRLLLPETLAMSVAMTDEKIVLGYAGAHAEFFPLGSPIHTEATHLALASQKIEVFTTTSELESRFFSLPGFSGMAQLKPHFIARLFDAEAAPPDPDASGSTIIPAGIVAPLIVRGKSVGTLKLYYESPHLIDQTQRAIAEGLAEILSTQLAMSELDRQVELATKAELHALQSQINPHFLFNTINTIAALIRTDPKRARELLREFAVFYRQTLENSQGLIPFGREVEQTERYLGFEVARFGDNRIVEEFDIELGLDEMLRVPSFIIQPVVENSVAHAMPPEGTLHIHVEARSDANDVIIRVTDDGLGMSQEMADNLLREAGPTEKGTGIAMRNVDARLKACFEPGSGVTVTSRPGEGTVVTLLLVGALEDDE